jgi:hypothetical protein
MVSGFISITTINTGTNTKMAPCGDIPMSEQTLEIQERVDNLLKDPSLGFY